MDLLSQQLENMCSDNITWRSAAKRMLEMVGESHVETRRATLILTYVHCMKDNCMATLLFPTGHFIKQIGSQGEPNWFDTRGVTYARVGWGGVKFGMTSLRIMLTLSRAQYLSVLKIDTYQPSVCEGRWQRWLFLQQGSSVGKKYMRCF